MTVRTRTILLATLLGMGSCSLIVTADRSEIKDDLYMPSPDAGTPAPPPDEGDDGDDEGEDAGVEDAGTDAGG